MTVAQEWGTLPEDGASCNGTFYYSEQWKSAIEMIKPGASILSIEQIDSIRGDSLDDLNLEQNTLEGGYLYTYNPVSSNQLLRWDPL